MGLALLEVAAQVAQHLAGAEAALRVVGVELVEDGQHGEAGGLELAAVDVHGLDALALLLEGGGQVAHEELGERGLAGPDRAPDEGVLARGAVGEAAEGRGERLQLPLAAGQAVGDVVEVELGQVPEDRRAPHHALDQAHRPVDGTPWI